MTWLTNVKLRREQLQLEALIAIRFLGCMNLFSMFYMGIKVLKLLCVFSSSSSIRCVYS